MEIESELADIFTKELNMTLPEMIVLESIMLDAIDAALVAHEPALALEAEDVLLDLHALKRSRVRRAGDGVLAFWERQLIPDPRLTFAGGAEDPARDCLTAEGWIPVSRKHNTRHPERSNSRYPERLVKRGVSSASVRMEALTVLRKRQLQRISLTGVPWATARSEAEAELLAA